MKPTDTASPPPLDDTIDAVGEVHTEELAGIASDLGYAPVRRLSHGDTVGRYVVLRAIGAGGMGEVFAAYDPELDRKIALKLVHTERAISGDQQRLLREAQA